MQRPSREDLPACISTLLEINNLLPVDWMPEAGIVERVREYLKR